MRTAWLSQIHGRPSGQERTGSCGRPGQDLPLRMPYTENRLNTVGPGEVHSETPGRTSDQPAWIRATRLQAAVQYQIRTEGTGRAGAGRPRSRTKEPWNRRRCGPSA